MPFELEDIISVSVVLNPTNQPYTVIGYWEDITSFPSKTHEEIRNLILDKYQEKHPNATRIDVRFP